MAPNLKVGGEVDAYCTRCRLLLAHTILAMVGTKIARVRCNTCGGDHAFRPAPGTTDRPSPSRTTSTGGPPRAPRASRSSSEEKVIISFEEQLAGRDLANAPRYSPKDTYTVEQVVQHPTFGLGLVTAVRGDKVDIAFKAETKTLIHGRGDASGQKPTFTRPSAQHSGPADKPLADPAGEPSTPSPETSVEG